MVKSKMGAAVFIYPDKPVRASLLLQECLTGFIQCRASGYIELTQSLIARLEQADEGLQQLTKREREIAVLAAQGLSNSEIAEKLYVSIRTVTTHIERIYSKLEIRSRTDLARYMMKNT